MYPHTLKQMCMRNASFRGKILDDVLRYALRSIEKYGDRSHLRKVRQGKLEGNATLKQSEHDKTIIRANIHFSTGHHQIRKVWKRRKHIALVGSLRAGIQCDQRRGVKGGQG